MSSTISNGSYARTEDGKIDLLAYIGKTGAIEANGLSVDVKINDARTRYGHLDLSVTPLAGTGERWVEYKNIAINSDPGLRTPTPVGAPALASPNWATPDVEPDKGVTVEESNNVLAQVRALLASTKTQ